MDQNEAKNKYFEITTPFYLEWQKRGRKIFPEQTSDELVIHVFRTNWTAFLKDYAKIYGTWIIAAGLIGIILLTVKDMERRIMATIVILMILMPIDLLLASKIINEHLNSLVLTSKRIIHFSFFGLTGKKSDSINFENLNEAIHTQKGVVSTNIGKSGTLILKLASGEERKFHHMPNPSKAANIISEAHELYMSCGKSNSFEDLFSLHKTRHQTKYKLSKFLS